MIGSNAGHSYLLTAADKNTFIGANIGWLGQGEKNTFIGSGVGQSYSGSENVAIGNNAKIWGNRNISIGYDVGFTYPFTGDLPSASNNIYIGAQVASANRDGEENIMIGNNAGYQSHGSRNTFIGRNAGNNTQNGSDNISIGVDAGVVSLNGEKNIFIGNDAGKLNINGNENTVIGNFSYNGSTVSALRSVILGGSSSFNSDDVENEIIIGYGIIGQGSNTVTLGNDDITDIYANESGSANIHGDLVGTASYATTASHALSIVTGITDNYIPIGSGGGFADSIMSESVDNIVINGNLEAINITASGNISSNGMINNGGVTFNTTTISGSYNLLQSDFYIDCVTTGTSIDIQLFDASDVNNGWTCNIGDTSFSASVNNISIIPSGSQLIHNDISASIDGDGDNLTIKSNGVDA